MAATQKKQEAKKSIISVKGLVNSFGAQTVHDGLDFDIHENTILGVVGGSGTGKSVLMRTILGLRQPNAGEVIFEGQDITKLGPIDLLKLQKNWGVLYQNGALFSNLKVVHNVELPMLEHMKLSKSLARSLAEMKIRLVGLPVDAGDKFPSQLSGGMVKRAALARALALDPKILFLDEPTAGLDPVSAAAFDDLILDLRDALGLSVVMITHDIDSLARICDEIAVLVDKKIIVDTLDNLTKNPHPWIKEYFTGPRMRAATTTKGSQ